MIRTVAIGCCLLLAAGCLSPRQERNERGGSGGGGGSSGETSGSNAATTNATSGPTTTASATTGSGPSCSAFNERCETTDCCAGNVCVAFQEGKYCAPICSDGSECSSNCCVAFAETPGFCVHESTCTGGICGSGLTTSDREVDACYTAYCCSEAEQCTSAGTQVEGCISCFNNGGGSRCDALLACAAATGC